MLLIGNSTHLRLGGFGDGAGFPAFHGCRLALSTLNTSKVH
jgi:hypothetical protein